MTDAEIIEEGQSYGKWITPIRPEPVNTSPWPRCVAVVGGSKYDQSELVRWVQSLARKYPHTTVVTGNGRGAESAVADLAASHGLTVETPEEDWWPDKLLQVEAILNGADVVVVVGSEKAARAAAAVRKHKLVDGWREAGRPLVMVAKVQAVT